MAGIRKDGILLVDKDQIATEFYLSLLGAAAVFDGAGGLSQYGLQIAGFDGVQPRYIRTNSSGQIVIPLPVGAATEASITHRKLIPLSGEVSSSGNNLIVTPTSGKKLRISYLSYNPSSAVEAAFRFGAAGGLFLRNKISVGGTVIAKDNGDFRYIEGSVDEILNLNLSAAVPTIWNALYTEV